VRVSALQKSFDPRKLRGLLVSNGAITSVLRIALRREDAERQPSASWCRAARRQTLSAMTPAACCHGTAHEIAALTGHASLREIGRYTRAADQARMARSAMAKATAQEQTVMKSVKPDVAEVSNPLKPLANA